MIVKTIDAKVVVECEYSTRPGAKKEYRKTIFYKRSKSAKEKIDQYSGSVEVSAKYEDLVFEVSGAVKASWCNTHSFSTSTDDEEMTSNESMREYYDDVTLLVRSLKFKYFIDDVFVENIVETTVLNLKENYTVDQLYDEAKKYMKMTYGAENRTVLEIPIVLEKEIYVKWKTFNRGDAVPKDAVYAGNTRNDGAVYVARVANTPGKVNLEKGKLNKFSYHGFPGYTSGEMLLTNGDCNWVRIKKGDVFPKHAVYAGLDWQAIKVWVGKSVTGEPGCMNCDANGKMTRLWCHHGDWFSHGYVLTIS